MSDLEVDHIDIVNNGFMELANIHYFSAAY